MALIDRIKNIIITPKTEWPVISSESQNMQGVITSYVLPLALAGAAAAFIGYGFVGVDTGLLGLKLKGVDWGLYMAISQLITALISVIISAFVIDLLAPSFGSEKNLNKSARLVAYAYTPSLLGSLLTIFPALSVIGLLFGLYGIYLWYLGLGPMKNTPEDKKVVYLVVSIVVLIVVSFVIGLILSPILQSIFKVDYSVLGGKFKL